MERKSVYVNMHILFETSNRVYRFMHITDQ